MSKPRCAYLLTGWTNAVVVVEAVAVRLSSPPTSANVAALTILIKRTKQEMKIERLGSVHELWKIRSTLWDPPQAFPTILPLYIPL